MSRREAYRAAMSRHGLQNEVSVVSGGQAQIDGQRAALRLVEHGDLPTALITYNDDTALAAMGVFAQQGIVVPVDISVIGWDDSQLAACRWSG